MSKPTNIFYDCEFLDDGRTIDLVSIGMCNDVDSKTLYLFNSDARLYNANDWVQANVFPRLPLCQNCTSTTHWSKTDDRVLGRKEIATRVSDYVLGYGAWPTVELWADYGAYDHVSIAQLFGPMVALPAGFPMYTNEYQTYYHTMKETLGTVTLFRRAEREGAEHDALSDAKWVRAKYLKVKGDNQNRINDIIHSAISHR